MCRAMCNIRVFIKSEKKCQLNQTIIIIETDNIRRYSDILLKYLNELDKIKAFNLKYLW